MADNITLDSMSGGSVVATDDIGGVHYQIAKLAFGALDAQTIVSGANGLPVELLASSVAIGKLAANSGVDIGDVTINNAGGGSAVNIQDGGNSITVDSANLVTIAGAVAGNEMQVDVITLPVSEISTKDIAQAAFAITLASLANGAARQSDLITNSSNYPAALIHLKITSGGAAPTVGTIYEVYLLRSDGAIADDGAGASDAAITIENAPLLGTIVVTASAAKAFYGVFDTAPHGPLGSSWGIAVKNSSGQAFSTTEGDHDKNYVYYVPENQ